MGRTVIVEDGIEGYAVALVEKKELVVGLIFGQEISSQKSCVIHLARSPEPAVDEVDVDADDAENDKKTKERKTSLVDDFNDAIVLDHVRQVILGHILSISQ